jgi:hypothetical protein
MKTSAVLANIPDNLEHLYLTMLTPDGVSTFASDNADNFKSWFLIQSAKLENPDRDWSAVIMIKRQFTALKDASTGLPIKKISACRFEKNDLCVPLTAEETRASFSVDAKTGKPLAPESHVTFVDFS